MKEKLSEQKKMMKSQEDLIEELEKKNKLLEVKQLFSSDLYSAIFVNDKHVNIISLDAILNSTVL